MSRSAAARRQEGTAPSPAPATMPQPANDVLGAAVVLLESLLVIARGATPQAPTQPALPQYETVADFAARLGVSEKTVRRMVADGMPHERPRPRLVRIPVARADAWIAAQTEAGSIAVAERRGMADARRGAH